MKARRAIGGAVDRRRQPSHLVRVLVATVTQVIRWQLDKKVDVSGHLVGEKGSADVGHMRIPAIRSGQGDECLQRSPADDRGVSLVEVTPNLLTVAGIDPPDLAL